MLERALENFWQKSARDYDERKHEKSALVYWRKLGVNRSRRQKISARGSKNLNITMMNDNILLGVRKPARYIGKEWNVCKKDFDKADIKFALCFPDLYEVGMSNLGIRILYDIINKIEDASCERFFAPDSDMEKALRDNSLSLVSLESQRRLKDFDIIGFSLGFELCYTNVLNMLDLGVIPLNSSERDESFPLVIGGGPCVLNPEPMHEFFDLFVLGEAEEVISEILDLYRQTKSKYKNNKISKKELLLKFAQISGVYVPSLYSVKYCQDGKIAEFKPVQDDVPLKVSKRIVSDLNSADFPLQWLVPYIQIVHDRITIEVMRGCPNRCRFCQARSQYFPLRYRNPESIISLAQDVCAKTGYEEISLLGLSVSDYPWLAQLLAPLLAGFKDKGISVSLPSIRPKSGLGEAAQLIATVKKTSLTFAPESASEDLRLAIGKNFNMADFLKTLSDAYSSGYQHVKLYFMIGLPHEAESDLDAIINFSKDVSELRRKIKNSPAQVNISVNTLIPKPHTPLQWAAMLDLEEIRKRQDHLRDRCRNRKLNMSFHNRFMSFIEGVMARGDRRLSPCIRRAFEKGCRLDGWDEHFDFQKWEESFRECGLDADFYIKEKTIDEILAWDFLDLGVSRQELTAEYQKTLK